MITAATGALTSSRMFLYNETPTDPPSCSKLFKLTMHEAGDVFGLDHPKSAYSGQAVMLPGHTDALCALAEYDMVASKAIYQSR